VGSVSKVTLQESQLCAQTRALLACRDHQHKNIETMGYVGTPHHSPTSGLMRRGVGPTARLPSYRRRTDVIGADLG